MQRIAQSVRFRLIEGRWHMSVQKLFEMWHWQENLKHSEIGKRLNFPRATVTRWFRELEIPTQSCSRFTNLNLLNTGPRKGPRALPKVKREFPWKVNQAFFQKWSEEMAYILGFFVADGNLTVNPRGSKYIEFTSCDKYILERVREAMGSNHKIGEKLRSIYTPIQQDCYRLQIGSKRLFEDLSSFGMIVKKSLVVRMPKIPRKHFRHFVRGYFDGDWHVVIHEYVKKGRKKQSHVLVSGFTSGSKKILQQLFSSLKKYSIVKGGSIYKADGFHLRFSVNDSKRMYAYMYSAMRTDLFLTRKKSVFENFNIVGR